MAYPIPSTKEIVGEVLADPEVNGHDMIVEVKDLRLSIGGRQILTEVNLSLRTGEIYGLLGPNGAGKSTTIAAILGLLRRDAGRVQVFGADPIVAPHQIYARLGVLPEQNGFYGWMAAEEYLGFFSALHGRHPGRVELRQKLEMVGLRARANQPIQTYSHGMRQRLGLARALVAAPELLILDEPTNGLDPRGRREIHDILINLAADGVGVLLCSHLLDDVDRLCRRVGIIVDGRTAAEGAISDLIRTADCQTRFRLRLAAEPPETTKADVEVSVIAREGDWWVVDIDPGLPPEVAWRELMFRGWPIVQIEPAGGGLEDYYLSVTERRAA